MKLKIYSLTAILMAGLFIANNANAQFISGGAGKTVLTNINDNVGIGTASPSFKLDIVGTAVTTMSFKSTTDNASILLDKGATNKTASLTYRTLGVNNWQTGCVSNINYTIRNNGLGAVAIYCDAADNKVGIGTTTPAERLTVNGNISGLGNIVATGTVTATGGNSTNWNSAYSWGNHASAGYITVESDPQVGSNTASYVPRWNGSALVTGNIYSSGNFVGINTTTTVGAGNFIVKSPNTTGYGGMYLVQDGTSGRQPFYGYSCTGTASMWHEYDESSAQWRLYNNGYQFVVDNAGKVGIGTVTPVNKLHVEGTAGVTDAVINAHVNYVGSVDVRAITGISHPADGWGYGLYGEGGWIGVYGYGTNATTSSYGVYGYASGAGGTQYGVYGSAYNSAGASWAGYFSGNTYASTMIVGSASAPSTGYALTVGGKIIATEVRVQLQPFPDYVFADDYVLPSINELEKSIKTNNRLPGMPSACDVEQNGLSLGEMQGKVVEKVEEQALYIISLQKQIDELKNEIKAMKK